jgi:hypothetical protein
MWSVCSSATREVKDLSFGSFTSSSFMGQGARGKRLEQIRDKRKKRLREEKGNMCRTILLLLTSCSLPLN